MYFSITIVAVLKLVLIELNKHHVLDFETGSRGRPHQPDDPQAGLGYRFGPEGRDDELGESKHTISHALSRSGLKRLLTKAPGELHQLQEDGRESVSRACSAE